MAQLKIEKKLLSNFTFSHVNTMNSMGYFDNFSSILTLKVQSNNIIIFMAMTKVCWFIRVEVRRTKTEDQMTAL
jgi:hypothetical protein